MTTAERLDADTVRRSTGFSSFDQAVILGSGLTALAEFLTDVRSLSFADLPGLPPVTTIPGQAGHLLAGDLDGVATLLLVGRFHLYQGLTATEVAAPVRLAAALGVRRLLLTNAAGGIHPDYAAGDTMFIVDHLNFTGDNPLRGLTPPPFVDLTRLYRRDLYPVLGRDAASDGMRLHAGTYAAVAGPSYETPAEVRALARLGADAVGMSTVHEAISAAHLGLEVAGLSLIANRAAGLSPVPLTHDEVVAMGHKRASSFAAICRQLLLHWAIMADSSAN